MANKPRFILLENADGEQVKVDEGSTAAKSYLENGYEEKGLVADNIDDRSNQCDEMDVENATENDGTGENHGTCKNDESGETYIDPEVNKETGKIENHVDEQGREETPDSPPSRDEMVELIFEKTGEKPHHALGMAKVIALYEKAKAG